MTRRIRGLLALVLLLTLAVGLPWALAATIGDPLHHWSSIRSGDTSDRDVIAIMAGIAWLAWASFALSLAIELTAAASSVLTHRPRPSIRLPLLGAQQQLARTLITGVLLLAPAVVTALGPVTAALAAPVASAAAPQAAAGHVYEAAAPVTRDRARADGPGVEHAAGPQHTTVYRIPEQGGLRTYWALAEHYLHDGQRWPEIWQLNQGRHQDDGATMDSPQLLRRGWTVRVPATEADSGSVTVQAGDTLSGLAAEHSIDGWKQIWRDNADRTEPDGQHLNDPNLIRPGWTITLPDADTADTAHRGPRTPAEPTVRQPRRSQPTRPPAAPHNPSTPAQPTRSAQPSDPTRSTQPAPSAGAAPLSEGPRDRSLAVPRAGTPDSDSDSTIVTVAEWAVVLGAGAGLLAASTYVAVRALRRRQFRYRTSGRAIARPGARHIPLESVLITDGLIGARDVDFIDRALRALAADLAAAGRQVPAALAARLTEQHLDLVLHEPAEEPPAPWVQVTPTSWVIAKTAPLPEIDGYDDLQAAPYPTLVSLGYTTDGEEWLLNLEQAASLTLTGDPDRCADLARFAAAELAHNTWSDQLSVTLAGFGTELAALNPTRLSSTANIAAAAAAALADLHAIRDLGDRADSDSSMPQLLFLAPTWNADPADAAAVNELLDAIHDHPNTAPVAVLLLNEQQGVSPMPAGLQLHVDEHGALHIPDLDLTVTAQQLPAEQAGELAQYLTALRDSSADVPMPPAHPDTAGGDRDADSDADDDTVEEREAAAVLTDRAGAVLPAHTEPRPETSVRPRVRIATAQTPPSAAAAVPSVASLLPKPTETYLATTAATAEDIDALAPLVDPDVAEALLASHPYLDGDLTAWHDPESDRAKLRLLGDVQLTAHGTVPDSNDGLITEAVAYLALHRRGVGGDQFAAEMWPTSNYTIKDSNPKNTLYLARAWLGTNPLTGERYLPHARSAGQRSGAATYRLSGLLVDWELFTALRSRAQARETHGQDGLPDLVAALDLVDGAPLTARRRRAESAGWGWLIHDDVSADDTVMTAAIVDVAHLVVTRALEAGDLDLARRIAELSVELGCGSDKPLLNLAAVCEAQGRSAELAATVRRIVTHHGKVVEEDLPPDTYDVLLRRGWIGLSQAS